MALHPRLPLAVVSHRTTNGLSVVNLETGELVDCVAQPNLVMDCAWNPLGDQLFAAGRDGSIWVWDWPLKPTPRHILRHHKRDVTRLSVHPGGRWLVSSGWDGQSCL